ncbi:metallophosphoesterase [Pseudomonas sp. PDM33]|nr:MULTISPECIES: metallophosphoesterase [unclassified Pseudomonas]MBV7585503.1 metallophosphoesterase [Pseudomonas sp. PDM33]
MERGSLRQFAVLTWILLIAGCTSTAPVLNSKAPDGPSDSTTAPATAPIGVISDTQIHESRGTASRYASKAGDEFVEVTIRTGQQVIGSTDILMQALKGVTSLPIVLHLGDALDVSCQTEWDAFVRTMRVAGGNTPWVLVDGNHDGFYVGNISPTNSTKYNVGYWNQVCNQGRYSLESTLSARHFDKAMLVAANVQHVLALQSNADSSLNEVPRNGTCQNLVDGPIACAAWHIDTEHPWMSYLTQLVRLPAAVPSEPPVYVLALDSSTYLNQPNVDYQYALLTGVKAGFTPAQLRDARIMVRQLPVDARFFIATHHHVNEWRASALSTDERSELGGLLASYSFLNFVLTAHTHEGGWYDHKVLGNPLLELNTGSLADPPLYYRDLQFVRSGGKEWRVRSNKHLLNVASIPECASYKPPTSDSGYTVDDQRSENDRLHDAPKLTRKVGQVFSALRHFFGFWNAKHEELRPQLLTYRDIVRASLPEDAGFYYERWEGDEAPRNYQSREELEARLEYLAWCSHKSKCSVTEKGNLLKKLEDELAPDSKLYPQEVLMKAHYARLCAAVSAAEAVGNEDKVVEQVIRNSFSGEYILPGSWQR